MSSIINNQVVGPLIKSSTIRRYDKGQTIVYPDDPNLHVYFIKTGAVMMETISSGGERKVLYVYGVSSLFPMVSFLDRHVSSSWFYTALTETEVYVVPYASLTKKLKEVDGFTAYNLLLRQILKEVHELLLHITDHAKTDSTEKLISSLISPGAS